MIKVIIYRTHCQLEEISSDLCKILDIQLSYFEENYWWNWKFKRGMWDGKIHLFNNKYKSFKLGLLYRVLYILTLEKEEFTIEDKRDYVNNFNLDYLNHSALPLRDVQTDSIISYCSKFYGLHLNRGIIEKPPRTGKTRTAAVLGKVLNAYPLFFIAHRIDLILQAQEEFQQIFTDTEVGMVGDGIYNPQPLVNVSTIQSICNAYNIKDTWDEKEMDCGHHEELRKLIHDSKTCLIDEVHVTGTKTYQQLPDFLEEVVYIAGFTGTATRDDGADLAVEQLCGPKIYSLSRADAVAKGYILPVIVYFVMLPEIEVSKYDWQTQKKEGLINNQYLISAAVKIVDKLKSKNMTSVNIVRQTTQGKPISEALGCQFLYSKISGRERKKVYESLHRKEISTIVSTVTDIGVNIPSLDAVIICAPSKLKVPALQRIRSNTPFPGKDYGRVFVLCPQVKLPEEYNKKGKNYLQNHWRGLKNIYKKEPSFTVKEINYSQL